jgi:hypothetical protein
MIKGGGTFADSCDNVLTIWRPNRFTDPTCSKVVFSSQKIKKQKLVGIPSTVEMKFDRLSNRYKSTDNYDYFDGSVELQPIYNPDKFHTSIKNDFEKAPF